MNKLLREYALLSGWDSFEALDERHKIFAELIIKECARVADTSVENQCEWVGGNILVRFGLK